MSLSAAPSSSKAPALLAAAGLALVALILADSLLWRTNTVGLVLSSVGLPANIVQGNPVLRNSADATKYRSCRGSPTARLPRLQPHNRWHAKQARHSKQSVTLMTQLSIDRMDLLEGQCRYWQDRLAASVYVPFVEGYGVASYGLDTLQTTNTTSAVHMEDSTSTSSAGNPPPSLLNNTAAVVEHFAAFHARMEEIGSCAMDLELVIEKFTTWEDPRLGMYPFNAMRNRAMKLVNTELVLLLDVDFLPSASLAASYLFSPRGFDNLRNRLFDVPTALVLPAFEYAGANSASNGKIECKGGEPTPTPTPTVSESSSAAAEASSRTECVAAARAAALPLLKSKDAAVEAYRQGELLAFHLKEYSPGHKPTNYSRWVETLAEEAEDADVTTGESLSVEEAAAEAEATRDNFLEVDDSLQRAERMHRALDKYSYAVKWREGYEPFVLMARKYVPWYDERFLGYGHDKVVHVAFMGIQLNVTFLISPSAYVIHLPHPKAPTIAITKDNGQWERLRMLYREAKLQMAKGVFVPVVAFDELCPKSDALPGGESFGRRRRQLLSA